MNTIRRIFRPATRLGIAAAALIAGIVAAPAAFATEVPPPGTGDPGTTTFTPRPCTPSRSAAPRAGRSPCSSSRPP